jgi:SOS response regulatory protein OraA/RecX
MKLSNVKKLSKLSRIEILSVMSILVGLGSGAAGITAAAASADTTTSTPQASSSVMRSVLHGDQLQAMAAALNLTTAQVQAHLKAHDVKQVVASAGLTSDAYHQKVQAQLTSELQAQGYSQTQIANALQHYQQYSTRS